MEKMRTDQTAGLLDSETISSFPVLSKEILKFYIPIIDEYIYF